MLNTLKESLKPFSLAIWVTGFYGLYLFIFQCSRAPHSFQQYAFSYKNKLYKNNEAEIGKVRVNEENFEVAKSKNKKLK